MITVTNGSSSTVTVHDDGPGFAPDFVEHAFDRFSRDDPARGRNTGGAGLGLAIARSFILSMDGKIRADPGPGGVVAFQLPNPKVDGPLDRTLLL